jgi:Flp pilus assembly protein CpaB
VASATTILGVRVRRALFRPTLRRLAVAALAVATVGVTVAVLGGAEASRARWGSTRAVLVATHDLSPGDRLDQASVAVHRLPRAMTPAGALSELPVGAVALHPILEGEPVVLQRLAPAGLVGPAALVGPGRRAVAVPRGAVAAPPLVTGDVVDVLVVLPPDRDSGRDPPAFPVAERATVVDVADDAISVAVPEADAARVAWAVTQGAAVLALAGG